MSPVLVCRCCGALRVERTVLDAGRGPVQYLRVTKRAGGRKLVGRYRTVADLARHVDLAELVDLVEADDRAGS